MAEIDSTCECCAEMALGELLRDPLTQLVMTRDGIKTEHLTELLDRQRLNLGARHVRRSVGTRS